MSYSMPRVASLFSVLLAFQIAGCSTLEGIQQDFKGAFGKDDKSASSETADGSDKAAGQPIAKQDNEARQEAKGPPPGMNSKGEVIDPKLVEAGHGKTVKGLDDWEGEITGKPVKGSKFARLKIGMPMKQVTDIAGEPTDQGAHITGKAFIPFFFGSDTYRYELVYKGHGRLLFAGGSVGNIGGGNLIWIIHSAQETGYR